MWQGQPFCQFATRSVGTGLLKGVHKILSTPSTEDHLSQLAKDLSLRSIYACYLI